MGMFDKFTTTTNSDNRFRFLPEEITDEITIGATCRHQFKLPCKYSTYISKGYVAYTQTGTVGFQVDITDAMVAEYDSYSIITVTLTPSETIKFKRNGLEAKCQMVLLDSEGDTLIDEEYPIKILASLVVDEVKDNDLGVHLVAENITGTTNQVRVVMYDANGAMLETTQPIYIGGNSGGKEYHAGEGISISGSTISADFDIVAKKSDIPSSDSFATKTALDTEVSDRKSADTSLESKINVEKSARESAISEVQSNIDKKQDALVSGTNIKTINGNSLLADGDLEVVTDLSDYYNKEAIDEKLENVSVAPSHYTLDGASLNSLKTPGVYGLTNVTGEPTYTTKTGVLQVSSLDDGVILQDYTSTTGRALRLTDKFEDHSFYVDGIAQSLTVIPLASGTTHTIKGVLFGNINITGSSDAYTKIILDGAYIKSTAKSAILNTTSSKLIIELAGDSQNYLYVNNQDATDPLDEGGRSSFAALHSEADLTIGGAGYLMCYNDKGHAIKGKDVLLTGMPHIFADAWHDAIHGKSLKIANGYYYINNAKDAFSAGSDNNDGKLDVAGGTLIINKCYGYAFDSKKADSGTAGSIRVYGEANITFKEGWGGTAAFNAEDSTAKIYNSATVTGETVTYIDMATAFGSATVLDASGNALTPVSGVYTLGTASSSYTVKGNLSGYKIKVTGKKVNLEFGPVYYRDESDDDGAFIEYAYAGSRLEFKMQGDSINYLYKKNGCVIKSEKNIQINNSSTADTDADLFIQCPNGYGIYAPLGTTMFLNDGIRAIYNCKYGAYLNYWTIGDDYEGPDEDNIDPTKKKSTSAYIINNTEYDIDLVSRLNSGNVYQAGKVFATYNLYGCVMTGTVISEGEAPDTPIIKALTGNAKPATTAFSHTPMLCVKDTDVECVDVIEYTLDLEDETKFPAVVQSQSWLHNVGSYTKEEANSLFATISAFNNLEARVRALEEKKESTDPVITGTDLTLSNVTTSGNDLNVGTLATVENNSLKL